MSERCQYHFSDGSVCGEEIYAAMDTPTGWRHRQGDESRKLCHWASPETYGPQGMPVNEQVADEILKRIALRYRDCEVRIFPDLPELTPVEAVLRCAKEEGFMLTTIIPRIERRHERP
jgi:hypothetical protein